LEVDLDVFRGKWKELEWGPLDADLNVINGDINILRSQVELKHGALQITGYKKNGIDSGILLKSHVSLKNQPVNKLLEDIGFSNMGISGSLDMEADLLMQGIETKDLIPSLSGTANIMINEGLVKKPRMFLKVLELMSLQKILQNFYKQRPPHLREKGLYFQNMQGDAVIDHGIARTENFVMKSPALNAVAIGEEDLVRQTHNLELFTQPLGTLETILRNIPIVGRILLGDEKKSILTVGYKVTGSWSEPDVKPVPLESFGKGVLGTLERILLTPVEIIKDIRDVTDKIIKDDSSSTEDQTNKEDNSNN
ncbi:AsmA-like C-terminal domain-containing protein, partial [Thermodesulfobacteriota bacterium]